MLGKNVLNPDGSVLGRIVEVRDGQYHYLINSSNYPNGYPEWNIKFPNWMNKAVCTVEFKIPQRNLSKEEVAKAYDIPVEYVSDRIYDAASKLQKFMYMPEDGLKLED